MELYKTDNSVPSSAMPDIWDNNRIQDKILNGDDLEVELRTGEKTLSRKGMEKQHTDDRENNKAKFDQSIHKFNTEFDNFLLNSGYQFLGDYESGPLHFSARNQYIRYDDRYWRLGPSAPNDFFTTGTTESTFEVDKLNFVLMDGDVERRSRLIHIPISSSLPDSELIRSFIESNPNSTFYLPRKFNVNNVIYGEGMSFTGPGRISGSGQLIGTVSDVKNIYTHVNVKNNLVLSGDRNYSYAPLANEVIVDPLSPDGINTVQKGIDKLSALASGGVSNITIMLRAGRHEISEKIALPENIANGYADDETSWNDDVLISDVETFLVDEPKIGLRITNYPDESPVVSGVTKWFFANDATGTFRGHPVVKNDLKFYKLYSPGDSELTCATSADLKTGNTHRNLNDDVTLYSENNKTYSSIRVPEPVLSGLVNLNENELQSLRVRLTHWFTSSSHSTEFSLDGDTLKFRSHIADTPANQPLTNGWSYVDGNLYGCPFYVENSKYFIKYDSDFVGTDDYAILPAGELAYFTTDYSSRLNGLLDFSGCKFVSVKGDIRVKYLHGYPVTVDATTTRSLTNSIFGIRLGDLCSASGVDLSHIEGNGVTLGRLGNFVTDCSVNKVTGNGVANTSSGSHHGKIARCKINDYALDQFGSFGICMSGVDIEVTDSVVINGGFSSIRCDSSVFVDDKSEGEIHYGLIARNFCNNIGIRNGVTSDRYATGDTGIMTINGRGPETAYWQIGNVFANSAERSGLGTRGIFLDDGVNGVRMINNLIWGVQRYSLDCRQVNGYTYNNIAFGNIFVGGIRFQSATKDSSLLASNIIFGTTSNEIISQDNRLASENDFKCIQGADNLTIQNLDVIFSKLTKFTMNYVRRLSSL